MKRIFLLWLTALLLLCGCGVRQESVIPTLPVVTEPAVPTVPAGLYDSGSKLEKDSGGALKVYPLGRTDSLGVALMGEDLLLFSGSDTTTLTLLRGEDLYIAAQSTVNCGIYPSDAAVQVNGEGMTYYDERRKELVFLDTQLREIKSIPLPDSIRSAPAISQDLQSLYYCTCDALRCMDPETGLDRLVKELSFSDLTLTALHCDDTVIACVAEDDLGSQSKLYISTQTGQLVNETTDATAVWTYGASYFATHEDGSYLELLVGDTEQGPTLLSPHTYGSCAYPLLSCGGAVLVTENDGADSITLDYYDLRSGARTAALTLDGQDTPYGFVADADSPGIWFLRYDAAYGCEALCRWDPNKSATGETISRFTARHSAEKPDLEGLEACQIIADTLSREYGVQIRLWTDAVDFQPWDYTLVPEYQVRVVQEELLKLDSALSLYPAGFLQKAAEGTTSGRIQICLVRSILGNDSAGDALSDVVGLQYWNDEAGVYDAYLSLAVGQDTLVRNTCHEIFHIIESRVMTDCKAYDEWSSLNPKGFEYDYDYIANRSRHDSHWIGGENRAFIDLYSMSYPKEDRARIMEYAMTPGNESYFESEIMQKKLRQLCIGIREAFGLKKSTEFFVWEQYLNEPLYHK